MKTNPVTTWKRSDIKALMVDVDGVLITVRPEDGKHWSASLEEDLGLSPDVLQREFFGAHWDDVLLGRAALMERLSSIIRQISRGPTPEQLVSYWFRQDSRLNHKLLDDLASIRASRVKVYLATNQEHMRAKYLMEDLGLAGFVDGIYYSACLGCKKPDRAFFNQIVRSFCIKPAQLLLIDDAIQNVIAAAEAGWNTLYWNSNSDLRLVFN